MKDKNKLIKVLAVLLVFVTAGVIYSCAAKNPSNTENAEQVITESETFAPEEETRTETERESPAVPLVCVHVCGAVKTPGVYYLEAGSRVHKAVEMAGGLLGSAADEYVNMAREVTDGSQIYIPTREEADSGTVPEMTEAQEGGSISADDGLVNINTASLAELATLPGIGESKADAIISYRENVETFSRNEDIMNVAGIKETSYEKIKDHIKVN